MNIHFIAIGGSIMHSLAIELQQAGHEVTGSDDKIYDPARSRLQAAGILPPREGWDADRIHENLDAVILGMHAFEDNPELIKARSLGIPIYSFPEFIYEQCRDKHRVVIAGSYGKSTITGMVMHVLEAVGKEFDYLVGASVPGFDNNVRLSETAPLIVIEGDEYLASRLVKKPKFLLYQPHMTLFNGISWDHINVFPSYELYVQQFEELANALDKAADIVYNKEDDEVVRIVKKYVKPSHYLHPFKTPSYKVKKGRFHLKLEGNWQEVNLIGKHNMSNIAGAWEVCRLLSVEIEDFLKHIATFTGVKSRLETVFESENKVVIKDYAHAPAKVKATVEAVRERYKDYNLIACVELHTFSSLRREFLPLYHNSMEKADHQLVFIHPDSFKARRSAPIGREELAEDFGTNSLVYAQSKEALLDAIKQAQTGRDVILMMSSGNFDGLDYQLLTT
ncbi:MAG: peptidoglycan synthetase [Bacteroidetes bacterium]|nr:MAG: peptidoglycan synthetase [Bacteroidota bacterium]